MDVLLTDHPWPDVSIEREICERAGHRLISGPIEAQAAEAIEALVEQHRPQAIMCCWAPVSERAISLAKNLKVVARLGVGLDNIAISAATERGAWVTNVPDYSVEEVSDHAIAMMLAHWRGIVEFDRRAKRGEWNPAAAQLVRTREKTVGIIGYGRIGRLTARKLSQGFGMRVLVTSPSLVAKHDLGSEIDKLIYAASVEQIQQAADAIVLHLPLTPSSHHMIDAAFLAACQRRPLLINVSRGALVDNEALIEALQSRQLSGAALDVIEGEPSPPTSVTARDDVIVTPHIAFNSDASLEELRRRCTEDVVRALRDETPMHPCNHPVRSNRTFAS